MLCGRTTKIRRCDKGLLANGRMCCCLILKGKKKVMFRFRQSQHLLHCLLSLAVRYIITYSTIKSLRATQNQLSHVPGEIFNLKRKRLRNLRKQIRNFHEEVVRAGCNLLRANCQSKYQHCGGSLQSCAEKNIPFDCKIFQNLPSPVVMDGARIRGSQVCQSQHC